MSAKDISVNCFPVFHASELPERYQIYVSVSPYESISLVPSKIRAIKFVVPVAFSSKTVPLEDSI
jgi:hypothetical protein